MNSDRLDPELKELWGLSKESEEKLVGALDGLADLQCPENLKRSIIRNPLRGVEKRHSRIHNFSPALAFTLLIVISVLGYRGFVNRPLPPAVTTDDASDASLISEDGGEALSDDLFQDELSDLEELL